MRAGAAGLAIGLSLVSLACLPAEAEDARIERAGYTLAYNASRWTEVAAAPPSELALSCKAADCAPGTLLSVLRDPRPLLSPGAGGFTPGAAMAAAVSLRAQDVTPGGRLIPLHPARPIAIDGMRLYLADYEIEDSELRRTVLATALMPTDGATLHWRLTAPRPAPGLDERFLGVLSGLRAGRR